MLFSGSASGYIFRYENIDGNLEGAFTKTDSTFLDAWEGTRTSIAVTDMDDDTKPDYVIGNVGGGLTVFRDVQAVGINETPITTADFQLFPNPTTDIVTIRLEDRLASQIDQIVIYNMVGQEVLKLESLLGISTSVDVSALMPGVYHVGVLVNGRQVTKKLLKL